MNRIRDYLDDILSSLDNDAKKLFSMRLINEDSDYFFETLENFRLKHVISLKYKFDMESLRVFSTKT